MRVRFTRGDRADLDEIFRYIAADNPRAAADLVKRILDLIELLTDFPGFGRPTKPAGRHVLTVPRAPYRVYYRIVRNEARILMIRHTSRRPLRTMQ